MSGACYDEDMEVQPGDLLDTDVAAALETGWGLRAVCLSYLAVGFGSHHWVVEGEGEAGARRYMANVDNLDQKDWLGHGGDEVFAALERTLATALALSRREGLEFVVGPVPAATGAAAVRLSPRYSLSLFPFVDGRTWRPSQALTPPERDQRLRLLARLHGARDLTGNPLRAPSERESAASFGASLDILLASLDQAWDQGPLGEPARRLLAEHAGAVTAWQHRSETLARELGETPVVPCLTHGEPKPDNWMESEAGLHLIDWDTAMLGRPERDLWHLDPGRPDGFAAYVAAGGQSPDPSALEWYRLSWTLSDVLGFAQQFRGPHEDDADAATAYNGLRAYLDEPSDRNERA